MSQAEADHDAQTDTQAADTITSSTLHGASSLDATPLEDAGGASSMAVHEHKEDASDENKVVV
jgi:hypothetical protein